MSPVGRCTNPTLPYLKHILIQQCRGEDARAVKRVKFKLHDKCAALVDLGRHLGMFDAKHKQPDAPIEVTVKSLHPDWTPQED